MSTFENLLNRDGASDVMWAMRPGMAVGGETVCRTFQPSFTVTRDGVLFAFSQGRLREGRDDDPKVILMSRSDDGGKTWNGPNVLTAPMNHFALSAYVRQESAGETVSLLTCAGLKVTKDYYGNSHARMADETGIDVARVGEGAASVLCRYDSKDGGETWQMTPLTGEASPLGKKCNGFTPVFLNAIGQVHVMEAGSHAGRYIIGCPIYAATEDETVTNHFRNHPCVGSGIIFSDDQGLTWHMPGLIGDYLCNECSVAATGKGEEILMIRRLNADKRFEAYPATRDFRPGFNERIAHTSTDGGKTWSKPFAVEMSGILCHGTLARAGTRLYFSIPAAKTDDGQWTRSGGTVYYSDDGGETWKGKLIDKISCSYSTVGRLSEETRVIFFGSGRMGDGGIGYRIFTDAWLERP